MLTMNSLDGVHDFVDALFLTISFYLINLQEYVCDIRKQVPTHLAYSQH